jgi:shikimate kinase
VSVRQQLVLIGLMGSGKTSVGKRCAQRLGRPFVDVDDVTGTLAGMPVPEFLAARGETEFRALERQAVADICASPEALVIACGGGTVLDPDNRARLGAVGLVVWLRAPAAVLARRVGDGATRPLIAHDPAGALARLEVLRQPAYEAAADRVVDTEDVAIDAVVERVLAEFAEAVA